MKPACPCGNPECTGPSNTTKGNQLLADMLRGDFTSSAYLDMWVGYQKAAIEDSGTPCTESEFRESLLRLLLHGGPTA